MACRLDQLKADDPDESDFLCAFAGLADGVVDSVDIDQYDWVHQQIDVTLITQFLGIRRQVAAEVVKFPEESRYI